MARKASGIVHLLADLVFGVPLEDDSAQRAVTHEDRPTPEVRVAAWGNNRYGRKTSRSFRTFHKLDSSQQGGTPLIVAIFVAPDLSPPGSSQPKAVSDGLDDGHQAYSRNANRELRQLTSP